MRDELCELLGKSVLLEGRLNRCEPNAIGSLNICLKAVNVYPWRTDVAISSLSPLRVDHGWLQNSRLEHSVGGIVEMYWMTAEITNYQRKNGSRDVGFRHRPSLCVDHLLDKVLNIDEYDQQVQNLQAALRRIQTHEGVFGFHASPMRFQKILQLALEQAKLGGQPHLRDFLTAETIKIKQFTKVRNSKRSGKSSALGFNSTT
ncbi:hypothetical protein SynA1840_02396 [Synechococcus sp. A18-40]|nr:hypothetical protein SynA1840_02396 [Synechococcus sp. A18-40]